MTTVGRHRPRPAQQRALFDLDQPQQRPDGETRNPCLQPETPATVSPMRDNRRARRLSTLAERIQRADEPIEVARLAGQLRDLAEQLVASSIRDANRAGAAWRDIGAALDIPFQTLYRRYGKDTQPA